MAEAEHEVELPGAYRDRGFERYAGETVLDDCARLGAGARAEARLIVLRFLAVQYFTNRLRGDWDRAALRRERSAALNALGTGLLLDRELRMLRQALQQVTAEDPWAASSVALVLAAATRAHERAHPAGALALYRTAFEAAQAGAHWAFAAAACGGIAALSGEQGDPRAQRQWSRRGRALARRARVA